MNRTILWTVPRSRGTALERSLMEHSGIRLHHELLSLPYLSTFEHDKWVQIGAPEGGGCYEETVQRLALERLGDHETVISKELLPFYDRLTWSEWLTSFKHIILVRDPHETLRSAYRVSQNSERTYFDIKEHGYDRLDSLITDVVNNCGIQDLLIVDSDALVARPSSVLRSICRFVGVEYTDHMLSWDPGHAGQWSEWEGWHDDAASSNSFHQKSKTCEANINNAVIADIEREAGQYFELYSQVADIAHSEKSIHNDGDRQPTVALCPVIIAADTFLDCAPMLRDFYRSSTPYNLKILVGHVGNRTEHLVAPGEDITAVVLHPESMGVASDDPVGSIMEALGDKGALVSVGPPHESGPRIMSLVRIGRSDDRCEIAKDSFPELIDVAFRLLRAHLIHVVSRAWAMMASEQRSIDDFDDHFARLGRITAGSEQDFTALSDGSESLMASDLYRYVTKLAAEFARLLGEGQWCVFRVERSNATLVLMVAALISKRPFLEIPGAYSTEQIKSQIWNLGAGVLYLTDEDSAPELAGNVQLGRLNPDYSVDARPIARRQAEPMISYEACAHAVLTSGTTGPAKTVAIPPDQILDSLEEWLEHIGEGDVVALNAWLNCYAFYPFLSRATTCVIPDAIILDPRALGSFVQDNAVTQIVITPTLVEMLLQQTDEVLVRYSHITTWWISGEPFAPNLLGDLMVQFPDAAILNLYGINETGDLGIGVNTTSIELFKNRRFAIVDPYSTCLPEGSQGTLVVSTPGQSPGYIRNGQIQPDDAVDVGLVSWGGHPWLSTDDTVRWDGDASITFVDRDSAHIKIRGYKISPSTVEKALLRVDGIINCRVTTRGEGRAKQLVSLIQVDSNVFRHSASSLRGVLFQGLPRFSIPQEFLLVSHMPTGGSQKRADLPLDEYSIEGSLGADETDDQGFKSQLAGEWGELLGLSKEVVPDDESFLSLGGSLLLVELSTRINDRFDCQIGIPELISHPTLSGMSELIRGKIEGEDISSVPALGVRVDEEVRYEFDRLEVAVGTQPVAPMEHAGSEKTLILTGVTGFLGTSILRRAVADRSVERVICLGRTRDGRTFQQRVEALLCADQLSDKVIAIEAELSQDRLGLADDQLSALVVANARIIHCAAQVNWLAAYRDLYESNVAVSRQMIATAIALGARLTIISTITADDVESGYDATKAVVEGFSNLAATRYDLPVDIIKCGDIGPSSTTGDRFSINAEDYIVLLTAACLETGLAPNRPDWSLNMVPVDLAAGEILAYEHVTSAWIETRELHSGDRVSWPNFITKVAEQSEHREVGLEDYSNWLEMLRERARQSGTAARALSIIQMIDADLSGHPGSDDVSRLSVRSDCTSDPAWYEHIAQAAGAQYDHA